MLQEIISAYKRAKTPIDFQNKTDYTLGKA